MFSNFGMSLLLSRRVSRRRAASHREIYQVISLLLLNRFYQSRARRDARARCAQDISCDCGPQTRSSHSPLSACLGILISTQLHPFVFRALLLATNFQGRISVGVAPQTNATTPSSVTSLDISAWIPNYCRTTFSYRGSTFSIFVVDSPDASTEPNVGVYTVTDVLYRGDVLVVKHNPDADEEVYNLFESEFPVVEEAISWCAQRRLLAVCTHGWFAEFGAGSSLGTPCLRNRTSSTDHVLLSSIV